MMGRNPSKKSNSSGTTFQTSTEPDSGVANNSCRMSEERNSLCNSCGRNSCGGRQALDLADNRFSSLSEQVGPRSDFPDQWDVPFS